MLKTGKEIRSALKNTVYTKSIFNTIQEKNCFYALRAIFKSHLVCPNVPISTYIDMDAVHKHFPDVKHEKLEAIYASFVVFDQVRNYTPHYMFHFDYSFVIPTPEHIAKVKAFYEMIGIHFHTIDSKHERSIKEYTKYFERMLEADTL